MRSDRLVAQIGLGAALLVFIPCMTVLLVRSGSVSPSPADVFRPPTEIRVGNHSFHSSTSALPQAVMGRTE
jgi:hypothetical protein